MRRSQKQTISVNSYNPCSSEKQKGGKRKDRTGGKKTVTKAHAITRWLWQEEKEDEKKNTNRTT